MLVTTQKKEALAVTSNDDYEDDDYVAFAEMKSGRLLRVLLS